MLNKRINFNSKRLQIERKFLHEFLTHCESVLCMRVYFVVFAERYLPTKLTCRSSIWSPVFYTSHFSFFNFLNFVLFEWLKIWLTYALCFERVSELKSRDKKVFDVIKLVYFCSIHLLPFWVNFLGLLWTLSLMNWFDNFKQRYSTCIRGLRAYTSVYESIQSFVFCWDSFRPNS